MSKLNFNRRDFLKVSGGALGAASVASMGVYSGIASASTKGRVVVVGGGVGGATTAKYIKLADKSIDVTLIEPKAKYYTGFTSNLVLSGMIDLETLGHTYEGLEALGIKVITDKVVGIDDKSVKTAGGKTVAFDRCVVSPGVGFKFVEGHSEEIANTKIPHAWNAGPQTALLRDQLRSMKDGGTVILGAPAGKFRCPPGPYERASQIALYLKENKPKSKVIVLDPKDKFSKFGLFMEAWKKHYGYGTDNSLITWVKGSDGGAIEEVDASTNTAITAFDEFQGDVVTIIPHQKAGQIAVDAGLVDSSTGWCPVDLQTFESKKRKNIHVIGDASDASIMPKSGYAASTQAKVCAASIVALLNGQQPGTPAYTNTCYSIISRNDAFSVAAVYKLAADGSRINKMSGGLTPGGDKYDEKMREREVAYALSWYENITGDAFNDAPKLDK